MAGELVVSTSRVPEKIEELVQFVKYGREELNAARAGLKVVEQMSLENEKRMAALKQVQELSEKLIDAEMKLGAIMATLPEAPGKRTDLEQPEDSTVPRSKKEILQLAGFSTKTAQRYEMLAAHPEIVEKMKAEARVMGSVLSRTAVLRAIAKEDPSVQVKKKEPVMPAYEGEEEDERLTPQKYITSARKVIGKWITDPAASRFKDISKSSLSFNYYKHDNGLSKAWGMSTIWLFPPYYDTDRFVKKLLAGKTSEAIVLVNNETESKWFKDLWNRANAVVFHTGKIQFEIPDGQSYTGPDCGQVFFYIGNDPDKFIDEFSKYGVGVKLRDGENREQKSVEEIFDSIRNENDSNGELESDE